MEKVAIVTGGTRGIGRAISEALTADGVKVAAVYGGNDQTAEECAQEVGCTCFKWDVGDFDACSEGIAEVEKTLGPVSILVNNAGVTRDGTLHKMKPEDWREVMRVDLDSMYNMCRNVLEGMRQRGHGRIVNISSVNGQKGQMGQVNYSAAKAGVIGFTRALAQETARKGITVNCIAPGYIDTDMVAAVPEEVLNGIVAQIPLGRLGKAKEIAHCVRFLVHEDAGFVTGSVLSANGGQYMG
ncbi:MAG: acetoacetyl-CoA reductase [bacterium]